MREPTSPGVFLNEDYLIPLKITVDELAIAINLDPQTLSNIIADKQIITDNIATKFATYFKTDTEFWLRAQYKHSAWLMRDEYKTNEKMLD